MSYYNKVVVKVYLDDDAFVEEHEKEDAILALQNYIALNPTNNAFTTIQKHYTSNPNKYTYDLSYSKGYILFIKTEFNTYSVFDDFQQLEDTYLLPLGKLIPALAWDFNYVGDEGDADSVVHTIMNTSRSDIRPVINSESSL